VSRFAQKGNGNSAAVEDLKDPRPEAARKRLRESTDRSDACEAVREIVSNLLGCEEMALFQLDPKQGRFTLIWSFGIEAKTFHLPKVFVESALPGVMDGDAYVDEGLSDAQMGGKGEKATAFVPIQYRGATAGMLALLRLLPQKGKIDELDRGLFEVLSQEAGKPLFGGAAGGAARRERKR